MVLYPRVLIPATEKVIKPRPEFTARKQGAVSNQ